MNIIESNGKFALANFTAKHNQLPVGVYLLKFDPREGYYLNRKPNFELPKKIYGDHSIINRWLTSYEHNSEKNMGIILSGTKGTGKTITAQKFCIESKKPVIIINEAYEGSDFVDFITSFDDTIIFIDEFEKIYAEGYNSTISSSDLLSMMDGNYQTKLIFLLTVNQFKINDYLINRLNRIKYRKHYQNLESDTIEEVIEDFLINKDHKESIYTFFKRINMCTFDLLINIIKEMNLFNQDAVECAQYLNLECEKKKYEIFEIVNGKEVLQGVKYIKGDDKSIEISRTYLHPGTDEDSNDSWGVNLILSECIITKLSDKSFMIESPKKDKFRFVEDEPLYLVF